jgi:hypothetical protein
MIHLRLIIAVFLLMGIVGKVFAFDSTSTYNSANMSYPSNSTISQYVVFNDTMKAGGTINFTVDAHAGGGRSNEHDTGQLRLEFYNSTGTLLGYAQTAFPSGNLPQMNAWSSAPGDNSAPWQTLTLTTNTCGTAGDCANVVSMKVIMIGTDSSWWAGNYGPQWRVPSVTFGGGELNILYNPEFGTYGSTMAQGWVSSSGWGACGTTSGSVMCTTTSPGVTANASGGGYDQQGGTKSGTAGGYTSTLVPPTVAAGGGSPPAPPPPTVISTTSSVATTTSTSGTITYTYNQPVIIKNWSDGTTTTENNGSATLISTVNTGSFNADPNKVNHVTTFVTRPTNDSKVYINQIGDYNNITVDQSGTKNNFVKYDGNGNNNNINVLQGSTIPGATNYTDIRVGTNVASSSSNNINVQQTGTGGAKGAFINIQDNNNTVTLRQQDSGNHWADVSVSGGNKTVDITQSGSAGHMASVQLTGPQPAGVNLQQAGNTQQSYSIQANCTTPGGCGTITVTQGR